MIIEFLMNGVGTILEMFQKGGVITYIITIIGIYGLMTSIEKILYFKKISRVTPPQIVGTVNEAMERGGSLEALKSIGHYQNPVSKIISEALKIGYRNKTEVEDSMERVFIVEMSAMTKNLSTIKTIIEISPLLGLIGTVLGIWNTFKVMGIQGNITGMAEGIYLALITTIMGLASAIILMPIYSYIVGLVEKEMDKIELAKKMTNWGYATMKLRVDTDIACAIEALQDSEGIVNVKQINELRSNIWVAFKPSMLEKSISNIVLEKCNTDAEIIESKLKQ